jgi:hypothetical protein
MGYLWDYVYYDDTLVMPIWQKDLGVIASPINPFQPIVISSGDYRGIYFCAVTNYGDLYVWKWNWRTGLFSELVFSSWHYSMRNISAYARPLSFVSSDGQRAFLAYDKFTSVHFAELTPTISQNLPPQYLGEIYTTGHVNEATVGYADDATFACVVGTTMGVRIFSWDNDFPATSIPRYKIPFQNASELTRPLIIFSRQPYGISAESPPILVYKDRTTKTTVEGLDLPANMKTGTFTPALAPQFCGYDTFVWNIPTTWNFSSSFDFRLLDWVKDETSWIYIKQATLSGINTPPEMNVLTSGYSLKHLSPVNLGVLMTTRAQVWVSGYAGGSTQLQDALIFADLTLGNFHLYALTPIAVIESYAITPDFATISPPTFHFERGCWYALVTYQGKIALLQIIHPQFFSKYFASVPAIEAISTDEKYAIFVAKTTAFYDRQHWSLAIVATQDSNLKEIVASTKERVTGWEVWETSMNGSDWYELPAGAYIEGQRWVRVKVPKSILEWKKDTFVARNPNKVWRLVFISEPVIV